MAYTAGPMACENVRPGAESGGIEIDEFATRISFFWALGKTSSWKWQSCARPVLWAGSSGSSIRIQNAEIMALRTPSGLWLGASPSRFRLI